MKNVFYGLKLKRDFDRIEALQWGHFSFFMMSMLLEVLQGHMGFFFVPKLLIVAVYYRLFFRVKKDLYYSFWTFSVALLIYFLSSITQSINEYESFTLAFCYSAAFVILGIEMYILSSPIYYPFLSWWEYDFRYRDDLKIKVEVNEESQDGRLTDLRREAGCVALFKEYTVGEQISISHEQGEEIVQINAEIMSRRLYSVGRPYTYGVKFQFSSVEDKQRYYGLINHWRNRKSLIRKLKYNKPTE